MYKYNIINSAAPRTLQVHYIQGHTPKLDMSSPMHGQDAIVVGDIAAVDISMNGTCVKGPDERI